MAERIRMSFTAVASAGRNPFSLQSNPIQRYIFLLHSKVISGRFPRFARVGPSFGLGRSASVPDSPMPAAGPTGTALQSTLRSGLTQKARNQGSSWFYPSVAQLRPEDKGRGRVRIFRRKILFDIFPLFRSPLEVAAIKRHCGAASFAYFSSLKKKSRSGFGSEAPDHLHSGPTAEGPGGAVARRGVQACSLLTRQTTQYLARSANYFSLGNEVTAGGAAGAARGSQGCPLQGTPGQGVGSGTPDSVVERHRGRPTTPAQK